MVNESDRLHHARMLLDTQVDDVTKEPWKEVRVPKLDKRKERSILLESRRQRLVKVIGRYDANEQIARENSVLNQIQPNAKYLPAMPQHWKVQDPSHDIRAFPQYQKLLKESKEHFEKVKYPNTTLN